MSDLWWWKINKSRWLPLCHTHEDLLRALIIKSQTTVSRMNSRDRNMHECHLELDFLRIKLFLLFQGTSWVDAWNNMLPYSQSVGLVWFVWVLRVRDETDWKPSRELLATHAMPSTWPCKVASWRLFLASSKCYILLNKWQVRNYWPMQDDRHKKDFVAVLWLVNVMEILWIAFVKMALHTDTVKQTLK